jgi:hypothetical protein
LTRALGERALTPPGLKRTLASNEHEPYLELLEWIFGGVGETFPPMSAEKRVAWMRTQLPRTYAMMSLGHRWLEASRLP